MEPSPGILTGAGQVALWDPLLMLFSCFSQHWAQTREPKVLSQLALYEVVKETLSLTGSTLPGRSHGGVGGAAPGIIQVPPGECGTVGGYPT